ncbi:unnamed protein product [Tuber melanosporum]|uniref:(Perigord truffle) hypothetical protein n=1 Tax=Tuber melanosporum (strain Mel28) TaxID=656061 RepID=D5GM06_TUBMM|nr:uncharacterized protein GSTUM_00010345001 [Tuber melanosporum]CAZ85468.1 unnamed protein product [Tuber melanosporum]
MAHPKEYSLSGLWGKLGLDVPTLVLMAKGALPSVIFTAAYQATPVAKTYSTLGYVVSIIAALSLCILPQAKLVQLTVQNSIAVALAAATSLLGVWTATRARAHYPSPPRQRYNASASAVSAAWLFVVIWLANLLKARIPSLALPVIMYTIFVSIIYTNGGLYTMPQAINAVVLMLKCFFTGYGLAFAVGMIVFPVNCRQIWWKVFAGYLLTSKQLLVEQKNFLRQHETMGTEEGKKSAAALAALEKAHADLFTKLSTELPMAKREIALGRYLTSDLQEAYRLVRATLLPLQGMTVILDIFNRAPRMDSEEDEKCPIPREEQLPEVMKTLHEPYERIVGMCGEAIEHVLLTMKLKSPPKKPGGDEEAPSMEPGEEGFCQTLEEKVQEFYNTRAGDVRTYFTPSKAAKTQDTAEGISAEVYMDEKRRSELYLVLFMEYLLYNAAKSLLGLARFAEEKKQQGVIDSTRLVYPTAKRLKKWLRSMASDCNDDIVDVSDVCAVRVPGLGGIAPKKDPEHLPARNSLQKLGNLIAVFTEGISSSESGFGLRVACATLAVALPAYFESSYIFFTEQRLVWGLIVIAIGMSPTSGASLIGFVGRVAGTVIATVLALINWYIVDGITPGVISFLWFFVAIEFYFVIKHPTLIQSTLTALVTHIIIVCYELQVRKIGNEVSARGGQPVLSINEIGPHRLLVTIGGLCVAMIFTIFPYPTTTRSLIRTSVSSSLFLLARTYSITLSLLQLRIHGTAGDESDKNSPGRRYEKARVKLLTESFLANDSLRSQIEFTGYEPSLRGRFPREQYDGVLEGVRNITSYLSIISYASRTFSMGGEWAEDLSTLLRNVDTQMDKITSLLCLLSASLASGNPLPPSLSLPAPFRLARAMEERDGGVRLDHLVEPGFVAFAVVQVAIGVMRDDLVRVIGMVEELVGRVEFPEERSSLDDLKVEVP